MTEGRRLDHAKYLATPLQVTWSMTSRCNLSCAYCLECSTPAEAPQESTEKERARIVEELIAARALKVYLSGGEPLLLSDVPACVARLREAGAAVRLTTNGTLVDDRVAALLAAARLSAAEVSLHPGTLERVMRGVRALIGRGVRTILRLVVTPQGIGGLEGVVEAFGDTGVECISFQEVMPLGRAAGDLSAAVMGLEAARTLGEEIRRLRARWGERYIGFASSTLSDAALGHPAACTLGRGLWRSCEIRPDGNVIPCAPAAAFGVRNSLHEKGLAACWRDLPALYAGFAAEMPGGDCAACDHLDGCRGGCRAVCFALNAGRAGGNPTCQFFRARG